MATAILSTRLDEEEIALLDSLARMEGFDRSAVLKSIFRKGITAMRFEVAVEKYRSEAVTLSRAAEIAGMSQWDFVARMGETGLELHYGPEDIDDDLRSLGAGR
jgi:predicted HTH domain antitoxin